jgi:hypothetical protein
MGDYLNWLREIRSHLQNAQRGLSELSAATPHRADWNALVESDLASLPPFPPVASLARELSDRPRPFRFSDP